MIDLPGRFVADASVTTTWIFPDEEPVLQKEMELQRASIRIHVPSIWPLEMANVIVSALRRGRFPEHRIDEAVDYLAGLPVSVEQDPAEISTLVGLATAYRLTADDAAYLELALRLGVPLATMDDGLLEAARSAGIPVLTD